MYWFWNLTTLSIFISAYGGLVFGLPAADTSASLPSTTTPSTTSTAANSPTPSSTSSSNSGSSFTTIIVIVVIFVVLPLVGMWFCCYRKRWCCFGREEKRKHYNAAYPNQIPGGVFLVPVNQFVPPDPKTGYAVRIDTPSNPAEAVTAAPPVYHGVIMPPRAMSPPGRMTEKGGPLKGMFRA